MHEIVLEPPLLCKLHGASSLAVEVSFSLCKGCFDGGPVLQAGSQALPTVC